MAKQLVIFSAICSVWLLLLDGANCTGNMHAKENHNYSTVIKAEQQQPEEEQRGRRDVAQPQVEKQQPSVAAAAQSNFEEAQNNDNKNILQTNFGSLQDLNIVKRAPSGFTGMRGKKEYEFPDFSSNPLYWDNLNPIEQQQQQRDEDTDDDENDIWGLDNGRRYKKTPTAFYGVRGKKYTGNDYLRLNEMLRKLEEEEIRESILQNFLDRVATTQQQANEISKRAPTGFTGMRGKRPAIDDNGMYDLDMDMEKRGPVNAFVGVRGKKDVAHQNFKRSPASEAYNRRGKNQRFVDFSNKFVAVRGKKNFAAASSNDLQNAVAAAIDDDDDDDNETITTTHQQIKPARARFYVNMLPSLLYGLNDKRTPSGFMGMRGKRDANVAYSADNNKSHERDTQ